LVARVCKKKKKKKKRKVDGRREEIRAGWPYVLLKVWLNLTTASP
jgi:hypothetical protein